MFLSILTISSEQAFNSDSSFILVIISFKETIHFEKLLLRIYYLALSSSFITTITTTKLRMVYLIPIHSHSFNNTIDNIY